jgi:hypothetical protein
MTLVFKHEAMLTFVGRLIRDREFSEWFVARPLQALASHGLSAHDLHDLADVVATDRRSPQLARALQPTVALLLELIEAPVTGAGSGDVAIRHAWLATELQAAHERLAAARAEARPWWKFW